MKQVAPTQRVRPWTTGGDLRSQVRRLWERGQLGRAVIAAAVGEDPGPGPGDDGSSDELVFPLRLRLRTPTSKELSRRYDEARAWIDALSSTAGVRIERRRVNHRVLGANDLPAEAWVDSLDDAVAMAGRRAEAGALHRMAVVTHGRRPEALAVLRRRPVAMLAHVEVWERLLDLVDWIETHPAPAVYVRQIELPGVDTKLIESHRPVLAELFDAAVPEAIVSDEATGVRGFERRYGFQSKPNLVRFRILDPERQLPGLAQRPTASDGAERTDRPHLADVTVDAATFAGLDLGNDLSLDTVFLVENEVNFLAFPERNASMVIWVAGYGTERLAAARWLDGLSLHYWGDLDTHGFAILDELRRRFPEVESFLMDRQSLLDHHDLWVDEPRQERRDLPRLTTTEARLYDDLRWNRLGERVRLEQERISFGRLLATLDSMGSPTTKPRPERGSENQSDRQDLEPGRTPISLDEPPSRC